MKLRLLRSLILAVILCFLVGLGFALRQPSYAVSYLSVSDALKLNLGPTVLLWVFGAIFALVISLLSGVILRRNRGVFPVLLVLLWTHFVFSFELGWFPSAGYSAYFFQKIPFLILPAFLLGFFGSTEKCEGGLPKRLKFALIHYVTSPVVFVSLILSESIFGIPGLGAAFVGALRENRIAELRSLFFILSIPAAFLTKIEFSRNATTGIATAFENKKIKWGVISGVVLGAVFLIYISLSADSSWGLSTIARSFEKPSLSHFSLWLGADVFGRSVLLRAVAAGVTTAIVSGLATILGGLVSRVRPFASFSLLGFPSIWLACFLGLVLGGGLFGLFFALMITLFLTVRFSNAPLGNVFFSGWIDSIQLLTVLGFLGFASHSRSTLGVLLFEIQNEYSRGGAWQLLGASLLLVLLLSLLNFYSLIKKLK